MQITLRIHGVDKTFIQPFVSGRALRRTMTLQKEFDKMVAEAEGDTSKYDAEKDLDMALEYVCEVFGNQFTPDQLLDGLPSHEVYPTYHKVKAGVTNGLTEALGIKVSEKEEGEGDPDPNV